MIALVTGASGFIGHALVRRLAAGGTLVLGLVREPARAADLAALPGVELVRGDLRDRKRLRELAARAELIYHLAGLTSARSRAEFMAINAAATGELAAAASAAASPPKLVYVSSLAAAGPRGGADPAREDDAPAPITPYGESKLAGERLLAREGATLRRVVVRPPWVYGPGDRQTLELFRMARRGYFTQAGAGRMEISLVHVDDLVEALLLAGGSARADGRVYYATDGAVHTVAELGAALLAACGGGRALCLPASLFTLAGLAGEAAALVTRRAPLFGRHKAREALQAGWVCDDARIRAELGYRSRVGLAEGVASTLLWYRQRGWL